MGLYADILFPRLLDFVMSRRLMEMQRPAVLAEASGHVLEIGFGTALNVPHYPPEVERLTVLDPADVLPRRVARRLAAAPMPVDRHQLDAARLPFESNRFDCVVSTWTLCSIADVRGALSEVWRVLKPGGRLLFVEHGRSERPTVARWQDRFNPLQRVVGCGCNLNRQIDELIREAGFNLRRLERWDMPQTPAIFAPHYRGVAEREPENG